MDEITRMRVDAVIGDIVDIRHEMKMSVLRFAQLPDEELAGLGVGIFGSLPSGATVVEIANHLREYQSGMMGQRMVELDNWLDILKDSFSENTLATMEWFCGCWENADRTISLYGYIGCPNLEPLHLKGVANAEKRRAD